MAARDRRLIGRVHSSVLIRWPDADVQTVGAGQWILQAIREHEAKIVLLDAAISGVTEETVAVLRREGIPVIALAWDERQIQRSPVLAEADDYLLRPVRPLELVARVDAAVHRVRQRAEDHCLHLPTIQSLAFDDGILWLDFETRRARVHERPVFLTRTEFDLLAQLFRCQGFVVPSRTLLEQTWRGRSEEQSDYLWIHMRRLRDKIEPNPAKPRYVIAERGFGYRFARPRAWARVDAKC